MRVITRQTQAKGVIKRCELQPLWFGRDKNLALQALGDTPDPDEVDRIVRYEATIIECDTCYKSVKRVVEMDCETWICFDCIREAAALVDA